MKASNIWICAGVIILALFGYVAYVAYPIYKAINQTKNLMAQAVPYQQNISDATSTNTTARISILVSGDSTAVGTGAATPAESTAGRIGTDYPNAEIQNIGVNGLKLDGLLEKFQAMPDSENFNLIVIQIGANDVVGLTPFYKISTELQEVLALALKHSPHIVVITAGDVGLAPVFRFPLSAFYEWRTLQVRKIFMTTISQYSNVAYVDLFKYRKDEIFNTDIPKYYAADFFHPSGAGYGVWYQSMKPAIENALSATST